MISITYKKAGVNISKADELIKKISPLIRTTRTSGVVGGIGGFGGLFRIEKRHFKDPVLVSSTDGVGTKLLLAKQLQTFHTVGIDLVAMCANDVVVTGARPLFFLDYFATGRLQTKVSFDIIKGITTGCRRAGCALIGGETAELPGLYRGGDFDLAGFCVGIVEKKKMIDANRVRAGDRLVGIQSSGLHSNGFSLVRKLFSKKELSGAIGRAALTPTILYVRPLLKLLERVRVKSMAHITGGGFLGNIPRVLPKRTGAVIDRSSWRVPQLFERIQKRARLSSAEMFRTFNMGIGMVVIMREHDVAAARALLKKFRLRSYCLGSIVNGDGNVSIV